MFFKGNFPKGANGSGVLGVVFNVPVVFDGGNGFAKRNQRFWELADVGSAGLRSKDFKSRVVRADFGTCNSLPRHDALETHDKI